ncbi:MAG: hypothetical protein J0G96_01255 [Flavobacteriia bacterium]|nr:hypothetical protein [Flavobacteriia bacterium]
MKQNFLLPFLMLLFIAAPTAKAQEIIPGTSVSAPFLKSLFENAYYSVEEVQDTYIIVRDGYKFYFDIDSKQRYVTISNVFNLDKKFSKQEVYELINTLSKEVALIKCYYLEQTHSIAFYYYYWTEGGFTAKSLISAFKLYKEAVLLSVDKDTKHIIL